MLYKLGVPPDLAAAEVRGMERMAIAKTANRSVLSSMNDFVFQTKIFFEREAEDDMAFLDEVEIRLAGMPCGTLKYAFPGEVARRLLGLPEKMTDGSGHPFFGQPRRPPGY